MIGLDALVQVTVLTAVALAVAVAMRRRSAAARHWMLASMLSAALVAPLISPALPRWQLPLPASSRLLPQSSQAAPTATDAGIAGAAITTGQTFAAARVVPAPDGGGDAPSWLARLARVWLAGVIVMSLVLLAGIARLWWIASRARVVRDGDWHDAAQALISAYDMRPVTLLHSQHPTLLVTWGLFHPRIILPAPAAGWSASRIRVVLRHELAHIRRGDWAAQLVAEAVRALHWYNPLVWVACRRLRDESELACDAALMQEGMSGLDYASELLELARVLNARRDSWTTALAMARPSSLERRVTAMLTESIDRTPIERRSRALAVTVAAVLAIGIAGFTASAQSFTTVSGIVVDQLGGSLPRVTLVLSSRDSERKYEVRADATGLYQFVGVMPGAYTLNATQPGFKNVSESVTIAGQNMRRNVAMSVGTLEETISIVHRANDGSAPRQASAAPRSAMQFVPDTSCTDTGTSGVIKQPMKVKDVRPVYPNLAGASRTDVLVFDAIIARDGSIREVAPKDADAQIDLANAGMAAVRQWRYTPTFLNCVPIEVEMTVTVQFKAE